MNYTFVCVGGPADGHVVDDVDFDTSDVRPGMMINIPFLSPTTDRLGWDKRFVPDEKWANMTHTEALNPVTGEWENDDLTFKQCQYRDIGKTDDSGRRVLLYIASERPRTEPTFSERS